MRSEQNIQHESQQLNLQDVIVENHQLQDELDEVQQELVELKQKYAALEEDFIHALQCEHKTSCPKSKGL